VIVLVDHESFVGSALKFSPQIVQLTKVRLSDRYDWSSPDLLRLKSGVQIQWLGIFGSLTRVFCFFSIHL
jgi:hypothetical protein